MSYQLYVHYSWNLRIGTEKFKSRKVLDIKVSSMQATALHVFEGASKWVSEDSEHSDQNSGCRWESWNSGGMEERGPPEVPLIVTPPCTGSGSGGGAALTTSRRTASARGSREEPLSTWRSSVRVHDTGFRGSRKSVVRLEPPCNGLNGLPAIGKEVNSCSNWLIVQQNYYKILYKNNKH